MKLSILLASFFGFTTSVYSQIKCSIIESYGEFIRIEKIKYNNQDFITKRVTQVKGEVCFRGLVNNNTSYIEYLLANFSSNIVNEELMILLDSTALQTEYINVLKQDSMFNSVMTDLLSKTINKVVPKDTVLLDQLMNIAVKFFSILKLNENGHYIGKVCAGLNDILKTEEYRHAQLEAFCFSSILKNYLTEEFSMYLEFVGALKELYKVNLGIDRDEKLLRAQGAMYFIMYSNENLKRMLISEYNLHIDDLPFVLKGM